MTSMKFGNYLQGVRAKSVEIDLEEILNATNMGSLKIRDYLIKLTNIIDEEEGEITITYKRKKESLSDQIIRAMFNFRAEHNREPKVLLMNYYTRMDLLSEVLFMQKYEREDNDDKAERFMGVEIVLRKHDTRAVTFFALA